MHQRRHVRLHPFAWWLLLFCALAQAPAQVRAQIPPGVLSGRVVDAQTGEALPTVNVFLAYTMRGAATDAQGRYTITDIPPGSYEIAVSMVGYAPQNRTVQVAPSRTVVADFELEPEVYGLDQVEVTAEPDRAWRRQFRIFQAEFLGATDNARDTEILNPYVLEFEEDAGVLSATASGPLEVENRSLGYRITFILKEFRYNSHDRTLRFSGHPYFEALEPESERQEKIWEEYRRRAFDGSLRHLFRSLVRDTAFEEGFLLRTGDGRAVLRESLIRPSEQPNTYEVSFTDPLTIIHYRGRHPRPPGARRDTRPDTRTSTVRMRVPWALVHVDGSVVYPWDAFQTDGDLFTQRLADFVPREYGLDAAAPPPPGFPTAQPDLRPQAPPARVEVARVGAWAFITGESKADEPLPAANPALADAVEAMKEGRWGPAVRTLDAYLADHPDDVEALYYRVVCARERGVFSPLRRTHRRITDRFESLLARDSLYRDVLYQYALYERNRHNPDRALALSQAQVYVRPDLPHAHLQLLTIYRHLLHTRSTRDVLPWLEEQPSEYAALFRGEAYRLDDRPDEARAVLEELLQTDLQTLPRQAVLMTLARLAYARGDAERGQAYVQEAIETISRPVDAWVVFEDFKYVAEDEEWHAFQRLERPGEFVAFFHAFWAKRNPTPARRENVRLTEHFRRLLYAEAHYAFYGFRSWNTDPDERGEFDQPETYALNQSFNDKGLIYIRFGEPDDRIVTVSGTADLPDVNEGGTLSDMDYRQVRGGPAGLSTIERPDGPWVPNESWRYYQPQMDFHFVVDGGGANWRLTPRLTNVALIVDRALWGGAYARQAQAARDFMRAMNEWRVAPEGSTQQTAAERAVTTAFRDQARYADELAERHVATVDRALELDRHTWSDTRPFSFPVLVSAFRGPGPRGRVEIHYIIPTGYLAEAMPATGDSLDVEVGIAVHDTTWQGVVRETGTLRLPAGSDASEGQATRFVTDLEPGAYEISVHQRTPAGNLLAGIRTRHVVPDFSRPVLAMSDVLPAFRLTIPADGLVEGRDDLRPVINPTLRFPRNQPFYLCFEIYNLAYDLNDRTSYRVEFTLTPESNDGEGRRNRDRPVLTLGFDRGGSRTAPVEFGEIDAGRVAPGRYTLTVTVTDRVTNTSASRSRSIELLD